MVQWLVQWTNGWYSGWYNGLMDGIVLVQSLCLTLSAMLPSILFISPNSADISDDLPAPTWPTTATSSPGLTWKLILRVYAIIVTKYRYTFSM